ncbi:MAG: tyrosine-type recombinase/integrase family protein, partial [Clostridia bacterium]|nr:tyrosine-type recombinase/integrase family protein [Clostridia bacterium]
MVTGNLQIKDGKYYAVVNLRDETGKRKQKWVSTGLTVRGNKKNAEQFLNQELEKWNYHNGVYYGISVAEYFEIWLTEIEKEVRPNTFRSYKGNMTNHIIPYFRNKKIQLQSIKPIDLENYYFSLLKPESNLENGAALSATTIRHHHQNISKALADAVRKGYIPLNPASSAKLPKKEKYKAEFLNHEQLDELISLFKGSPVELPVRLCAIYGFRRSEVLGLKWKNVDFINR